MYSSFCTTLSSSVVTPLGADDVPPSLDFFSRYLIIAFFSIVSASNSVSSCLTLGPPSDSGSVPQLLRKIPRSAVHIVHICCTSRHGTLSGGGMGYRRMYALIWCTRCIFHCSLAFMNTFSYVELNIAMSRLTNTTTAIIRYTQSTSGASDEAAGAAANSPGSNWPYKAQNGRKKEPPAEKSTCTFQRSKGRSGPAESAS